MLRFGDDLVTRMQPTLGLITGPRRGVAGQQGTPVWGRVGVFPPHGFNGLGSRQALCAVPGVDVRSHSLRVFIYRRLMTARPWGA